jgi:hypothetical protein
MRGSLMAKLLSGAWRLSPPSPLAIQIGDLQQIQDLLLESGTASLAWWRIRHSELAHTPAAKPLQTAYRVQSLKAVQREQHIGPLLGKFRRVGMDPILIKGWSLARLYPESGLRPYCDIDFVVPDYQAEAALSLVADGQDPRVDLEHEQITRFDQRTWNELRHRSCVVTLGKAKIRVLSPEDELRAQCIHFLKHGGCGPLSLCDIALLVESRSAGFDWDICLGKASKQRSWINCALLLAHGLLGMSLEGVPLDSSEEIPRWVFTTVLDQWGQVPEAYQADVRSCLRHPARIAKAIADRWPPNPIVATLTSGSRFGVWPTPVLQIADVGLRLGRWILAGARTVPSQPGIRTEWA